MRRVCFLLYLSLLLSSCMSQNETPGVTIEPVPSDTPAPIAEPTGDGVVAIAAVGDIMLARDLVDLMDANGATYPYERVADLLEADITIGNMEGAFTERGIAADKLYTFRTPPRFAVGLAQAGFDVVSLGNNHAMDFGIEGLEDTLAALDGAGIRHAGAGLTEAAARAPAYLEVDGLRIAFLSYNGFFEATFAGPNMPGVADATVANVTDDVRAAATQADAVIVALHAGVEYTDAPDAQQQEIGRAAIDAGAALVLGHHPHTLQGWEEYGAGLIVYSLGNFVFDLDADDLANLGPRAFETVVLLVTLDATGVRHVRAEPVYVDPAENRPRPASPEEGATILERLALLHELANP